jgi:phage shock protein A
MSDNPPNLVLEHLRHLRAAMDGLRDDVRELKHRMSSVEQQIANALASETNHYVTVSNRLDRVGDRLDRIERRLDIVPAK